MNMSEFERRIVVAMTSNPIDQTWLSAAHKIMYLFCGIARY